LLTFSTEPDVNVVDTFNKEFFKIDGLKYSDDWKLQIDNLKNIDVEDVYNMYDTYFNNNNMMFVVLGDFNDHDMFLTFKQKLKLGIVHSNPNFVDCYSFKHDIIFFKQNIENTKILIGFPYTKMSNYIYINLITSILHTLLFDEMRTSKSILYDIDVYNEINLCGTTLYIEFDVQTIHAKYALKSVLSFISKLNTMPITNFAGFKNKEIYDYMIDHKSIMEYYVSLIYTNNQIYTKKQIIDLLRSTSQSKIKHIMLDILQIKNALCVYESKQDLHLSWKN